VYKHAQGGTSEQGRSANERGQGRVPVRTSAGGTNKCGGWYEQARQARGVRMLVRMNDRVCTREGMRGRGRGRYACVNRALARAVNGDDDAVVATPIGPSQAYQRSPYHFAGGKDGITAIHLLEWC